MVPNESIGSSIQGMFNNMADKAQKNMRSNAIIDNEVTNKISKAAADIGGALSGFGASVFGSNKKNQQPELDENKGNNRIGGDVGANLNFSDDEDEMY